MPFDLVPVVIASLVALVFIQDGYQPRPKLRWGQAGQGGPISLRTRWALGLYLVLLTLAFLPEVKARLPSKLPGYSLVGLFVMFMLMGLLDSLPLKGRLFRRGKRRASALSGSQQRQLRRERKEQRQRKTGTRRDS